MTTLRLDDRWLWLGFGIVSILAAHGIRQAMRDLVTVTKLDPYSFEPNKVRKKDARPEDGISVTTLQTLAASTDPNIANSAIGLIVSRVKRSTADMTSIRRDLHSKDQETRRLATMAFDLLRQWSDGRGDSAPSTPSPTNGTPPRLWSIDREENDRLRAMQMAELGFNPWAIAEERQEVVASIENPREDWPDFPRQRSSPISNGDGDEVERRRRRREAIVLHEGPGRLEEGDIIRPVRVTTSTRSTGEDVPLENEV